MSLLWHYCVPWVRKILWRGKWHPTPVLLPGKSHGRRSLVGYSPWGCKETDTTERLHFHFHKGSTLSTRLTLCVRVSHSVVFDSMRPHGLQPARLLCPWNSPGNNTGVGSHSLLQGSNPGLLHYRQILDCRSHQGSSKGPPFNTILLVSGDMTSPQECWRTQTFSRQDYMSFDVLCVL